MIEYNKTQQRAREIKAVEQAAKELGLDEPRDHELYRTVYASYGDQIAFHNKIGKYKLLNGKVANEL